MKEVFASALRALVVALTLSGGLLSTSALAAIAYVQGNFTNPASPETTVTATYSDAQLEGGLNVVVIGWVDSTHYVQSVTDTSGNIYSVAASPIVVSGSRSQVIYYAKNIIAANAGNNTVTVIFDGAANAVDLRVLEYSGIDTLSALDVSVGASGDGTALDSGFVTTTYANDLLIGANDVRHSITADGPNYTQRLYTGNSDTVEDRIVSTTDSYNATATQGPDGIWIMQMVAFKASTMGGGGDTQGPTIPTSLTATTVSSSQIDLSWSASVDNVGVTGYLVERCTGASCSSFTQIGSATGTSYNDTGLSVSTVYGYRVRARDAVNNRSGYSSAASATTQSGGGGGGAGIAYVQGNYFDPQTPQSTVTVQYSGGQTAGDLNLVIIGWVDSTHHVQSVTDTSGNTYSIAASPIVVPGSRSQVIYYAKNIAAASSGNTVTVTFDGPANAVDLRVLEYSGLDTNDPLDVSVGASGNGYGLDSGFITTTYANDLLIGANDVEHSIYSAGPNYTQRLYTDNADNVEDRIVTSTGSYNATATQGSDGVWIMQMVAFKGASTEGGGDTQAPTDPANLTANAVSTSQINLSWTASTDDVGVTAYVIERCQGTGCSNFSQIATPTGSSYSDTGLTTSVSYSYRVRAKDAVPNYSGYSSTASATTQAISDTQAPSTPTNLLASAASSTQINLSWAASTDDVAVTGCLVERCQGSGCSSFAQIGTTTINSYGDSGRSPSTSYSYRVRARDAVPNYSGYSSVASVITPANGVDCD